MDDVRTAAYPIGPAEPRFIAQCQASEPPAGMQWHVGWFTFGGGKLYGISLIEVAQP